MTELLDRLRSALGDRYTIKREIGRGGMAAVFLADDHKHEREVAIKVLHPDLALAVGGDRFLREINIAAHLRHPHIVPLLDSGEDDGVLYYVMPYVEGESLRHKLATHGRLDIPEAIRFWRDVIDAVAYAHRHQIVHRDIKPENVLLADRHALLVDFGIGKAFGQVNRNEQLTSHGMAVGTPAYMAPEQLMASQDIDHRVDVYALGMIAFEMLSGRPVFPARTPTDISNKFTASPPDIRVDRPEVPEQIATAIMQCVEPDPANRWQSADELLERVEAVATAPMPTAAAPAQRDKVAWRRSVLVAGVLVLALAVTASIWVSMSRAREERWARATGLPELRRLAEANISDSAFIIASQLRRIIPSDAEVDSLLKRMSVPASFHTSPEGARVYWTAYRGDTTEWHLLGNSPLSEVRVPAPRFTVPLVIRYEKPGFKSSLAPLWPELNAKTPALLDSVSHNDGMVWIRGDLVNVPSPIRLTGDTVQMPDFFLDAYEVTNRQFKTFVAAGGYSRKDLWDFPFAGLSGVLSFEDAMSRFRDKTGRPGPASWEAGDIPAGKENFPVNGISWYEAQAYAKFAGKSLPTIYHWRHAAYFPTSSWVLPGSNIDASALIPVGQSKAITSFGIHDMAGNVREWCVNANGGKRYILGGGWSDNAYIFVDAISEDPMDRSEMNGMRLMKSIHSPGGAAAQDVLSRPAARGFRDYTKDQPASEGEFRSFVPIFDYDRTPLRAIVEKSDSSDPRWIKQTITYDAAYGQEKIRAYLFLPRNSRPPYQTVLYYPGASVVDVRSSEQLSNVPSFLVTNGRALLYPVYKDTYERGGDESVPMGTDPVYNMTGGQLPPIMYRDHVIMYVKDVRRSVDYLQTRADVDTTKLAYLGYSWGGRLGPITLSVDHRFKVAVFALPGLNFAPRRKEVDEFNYLPHSRIPTLVLSGRYDDVFPLQTSAIPFFERLGTATTDKRHHIYPTQHFLPRDEYIRETLDWLDHYLGKVNSR
ncbi:MAG TPA: protein kinase [Gemmatimonadaceae bacterium]|nr:protein kinase [Gemmatimonadaceae bacterium]